jgi:hypothetical protein
MLTWLAVPEAPRDVVLADAVFSETPYRRRMYLRTPHNLSVKILTGVVRAVWRMYD